MDQSLQTHAITAAFYAFFWEGRRKDTMQQMSIAFDRTREVAQHGMHRKQLDHKYDKNMKKFILNSSWETL